MTDTKCDLVAYTECAMEMEATPCEEVVADPKNKPKYECANGTKLVQHLKKMPFCVNVTKQNCVSKWEVDPQVGAVCTTLELCRQQNSCDGAK